MSKKYVSPAMKCKRVSGSEGILAGSLNMGGFPVDPPTGGGGNDGSHPVNAKNDLWADDEEE